MNPPSLALGSLRRHAPEVGAECPNRARSDLCGERSVMGVPTAISLTIHAPGQDASAAKILEPFRRQLGMAHVCFLCHIRA